MGWKTFLYGWAKVDEGDWYDFRKQPLVKDDFLTLPAIKSYLNVIGIPTQAYIIPFIMALLILQFTIGEPTPITGENNEEENFMGRDRSHNGCNAHHRWTGGRR